MIVLSRELIKEWDGALLHLQKPVFALYLFQLLKVSLIDSRCFRDDQAAIAAFFSACFLFLAGSPVNVIPANSTVPVKTGRCPRPDLNVVYCGNGAPTLCAISCKRFL